MRRTSITLTLAAAVSAAPIPAAESSPGIAFFNPTSLFGGNSARSSISGAVGASGSVSPTALTFGTNTNGNAQVGGSTVGGTVSTNLNTNVPAIISSLGGSATGNGLFKLGNIFGGSASGSGSGTVSTPQGSVNTGTTVSTGSSGTSASTSGTVNAGPLNVAIGAGASVNDLKATIQVALNQFTAQATNVANQAQSTANSAFNEARGIFQNVLNRLNTLPASVSGSAKVDANLAASLSTDLTKAVGLLNNNNLLNILSSNNILANLGLGNGVIGLGGNLGSTITASVPGLNNLINSALSSFRTGIAV